MVSRSRAGLSGLSLQRREVATRSHQEHLVAVLHLHADRHLAPVWVPNDDGVYSGTGMLDLKVAVLIDVSRAPP